MGDCQARFCERLGGEIPPCLLDFIVFNPPELILSLSSISAVSMGGGFKSQMQLLVK